MDIKILLMFTALPYVLWNEWNETQILTTESSSAMYVISSIS